MNYRERVITTLSHRQPDMIPYHIEFTSKIMPRMVEFYGGSEFISKLGNCLTVLGCEPVHSWQEVSPNIWRDQFGVEWDQHVDKDIGVVCNRLVTPANLNEYHFPNPDDPTRYQDYQKHSDPSNHYIVVNFGFNLFERAWTLAGEENILMGMIDNKPFVHSLMDKVLDFNLRIIRNVCKYNIDAMMFGDDWGYQRGVVMGPKLWREFIKPRVREMYQAVKAYGKRVFIHSCGKVDELFPDLIECGIDVFNPFQPEVINVYEVKQKFGDRLAFFGGISTQSLLPYGTVNEVKDQVKRLLELIGKNGGYIAAPAHSIPGDAKPENVAAMIEILQNQ